MILCPWKDLPRYAPLVPGMAEAIAAVNALNTDEDGKYPLPNGGKINVSHIPTKPAEGAQAEAHKNYLDIHYILEGEEIMGWAPLDTMTPAGEFNTEKDVGMYTGDFQYFKIPAGYCCVVFPEDGHMPNKHLDNPNVLHKVVVKLKV